MLTLSTHVSVFTLHTVIWFTLSKHMLGSKFSNFHWRSIFSCLHSPPIQGSLSIPYLVYTLQTHVRFKIFNFSREFIFSYFHSPHMFQCSLSIQLFNLLSKHMLGSKFFDFQGISFFSYLHPTHVSPCSCFYTLQADVTLKKNRIFIY